MSYLKGNKEVTRQNFSMHPDLMESIMRTAHILNEERATQIVEKRAKRVTFSKVVATFAWLLKTKFLDENGRPTDELRELILAYEGTDYEKIGPSNKERAPRKTN